MNTDLKDIVDGMETQTPLAWKAVHPRNYTPPTGYCNPRYYSGTMLGNLLVVMDDRMHELPHLTGYLTALSLIANRMPTYFIAYEFAQAVANTDLPRDFKFSEIKWPMDAQLFVLPDQFIEQYYGCYAPFIAIGRTVKGIYPDTFRGRLPQTEIPYTKCESTVDRFLVDYPVFHANGTPTDYNGNYPISEGVDVFNRCDWVDTTHYEEELRGFTYPQRALDLNPEAEKVFIAKAIQMALKLILAVACRPAAIEHGQISRPAKIKHGKVVLREMWSPNIIGRTYRIPRRVAGQPRPNGASPGSLSGAGITPGRPSSSRMSSLSRSRRCRAWRMAPSTSTLPVRI